MPYARQYLQIIVGGAVFQVVGFGLNAVIRGEGNPRIAMTTLLVGVFLNVLLAPILIFGLGWGIRVAAIATVVSQGVSASWVVAHFFGRKSVVKLRLRNIRLQWPLAAAICALGSPHFLVQLAASAMNSILNNQLEYYGGKLALSVWGVVFVVAMTTFMPVIGINQGVQPIIGYNYGAERYDRVKRALQLAVCAATLVVLAGFSVAMLFPAWIIRRFSPDNEAMLELGVHAMRISVAMLPLVGFQVISASYFQAIGKPTRAMVLMLSRQVLLLIPAVIVLPRFFGLDGVWAALPAADLFSSLVTGVCLFTELRHLHRRHVQSVGESPVVAGPV